MPTGIMAVGICIIVGGCIGALVGKHLPDKFKTALPVTFSLAVMGMGIFNVIKVQSLPAVVTSLFFGNIAGIALNLEKRFRHAGEFVGRFFFRESSTSESARRTPALDQRTQSLELYSLAIVLFCTGPVGIYGAVHSHLSGDHSMLYAKSLMDLFTSFIFAASAGVIITTLAIPVVAVLTSFYLLAGLIAPYITTEMLADFSGCGGMIILGVALRMAEIRKFQVSDMLPALVFIMPISYLWSLLPL